MTSLTKPVKTLAKAVWGDSGSNTLWQRIVKCSAAITISVIVVIIPAVVTAFGPSTFLCPLATIFGHPGQRTGLMIEALLMILLGSLIGVGWSLLGLYVASLVFDTNPDAAYAIRAIFFLVSIIFHGYVRSSSPRLFPFVAFLLIATIIVLLSNAQTATLAVFTRLIYPLLCGSGISLLVNIFIFPELSSSFLGLSTIDTLYNTMDTLTRATFWFTTPGGDGLIPSETGKSAAEEKKKKKKKKKNGAVHKFLAEFPNPFQSSQARYLASNDPVEHTTIAGLTGKKAKLRSGLTRCTAAQKEINYEISISPLPPSSMKPLSTTHMSSLVQSTITLIGACENKFIVLENEDRSVDDDLAKIETGMSEMSNLKKVSTVEDFLKKVENARPIREIEGSSASFLETILERIRKPVREFETALQEAVVLVISCLAYCYDVPELPSGTPAPKGIHLQELDLRIDLFTEALAQFDLDCEAELKRSAIDPSGLSIAFMPRMETFLVSSFVLAFRQAAIHVLKMLRHVRQIVEDRKSRNDKSTIWFPQYTSIQKWLVTGGDQDALTLPETARKEIRRGKVPPGSKPKARRNSSNHGLRNRIHQGTADEEKGPEQAEREKIASKSLADENKNKNKTKSKSKVEDGSWISRLRGKAADTLEWIQDSDDLAYASKLAVAVFIVSWPAFVPSLNGWYASIRGIWAPLQLFIVFDVAVGSSFAVFTLRLFGSVAGCVIGYLSYEIGRGNRIAMVVILAFGIVPSSYIQLGTKYVKTGLVANVTMCVVALCEFAAINRTAPAVEVFYRRLVAFMVGGLVAIAIEMLLYPVRARHRLVESLSASVKQIQNMQAATAVGVDSSETPNFRAPTLHKRFSNARNKARGALAAAETFLPFCSKEPRLKGSFKPLAPIYEEIIYVLHQIIDRMDNVVQLRKEYGSSILEDLNTQVSAYRRNAAASIMLVLFSVNEALTTWQPLPQFIPSSRLAQLRLVNHVREVLSSRSGTHTPAGGVPPIFTGHEETEEQIAHLITQKRFLSWNASTAGQMEIIEYLEELVELVKLLVGVNAFRSGMLEKPDYSNYRQRIHRSDQLPLATVPTAQDNTPSDAPTEDLATAVTLSPSEPDLQRTQTVRERAEQLRDRLRRRRDDEDEASGSDTDDRVPVSLQRVGTRLWENDAVTRRRAFTLSHDST
ncbi:hypothetical protein BGZ63DRAFT_505607 [Mariannaea sp. PMI_226]|nr:hypothetical protein BGZ63DRAFT_505607 [Mariannaea sp. PMI_226]